jgi:hypothetical protein
MDVIEQVLIGGIAVGLAVMIAGLVWQGLARHRR